MRSLRLLRASVIALLAVAAMPAASPAETRPHWFSEGKLLSGEPMSVKGAGGGVEFGTGPQYGCFLKDTETISNPPGGGAGTDEMVAVKIKGCENSRGEGFCGSLKLRVIRRGLPWRSHLAFGSSNQVDDVIEGVALELRCKKGANKGIFSGTLTAFFEKSGEPWLNAELSNGSESLRLFGIERLKGPPGHRKITAG